jgi:hypothetical protein
MLFIVGILSGVVGQMRYRHFWANQTIDVAISGRYLEDDSAYFV